MTVSARLANVVGIRSADVWKAGRPAATLRRTDGAVTFTYLGAYLDADGPSIATTLPRSEVPLVTPAGSLPPFFTGLLPEGRRLTSLRRAVKTSADDDLSLLLAVGEDLVGDVQVVPTGERPAEPEPLLSLDRGPEAVDFSTVLTETGVIDPTSLPGVQEKASARMISVPVRSGAGFGILKLDPPEFPHVVENEAYFMRVAATARFPVARAELVHDARGRPGLLVERFDRVLLADGSVGRLAVEDAGQVLGRHPADKYAVTTEEVAAALSRACPATIVAARQIFRQICFAWLTGNGDLHAKNMSILATVSGEWRISPAYDIPSTLPYLDRTMALPIGGRRDGLSRRTLVEFATSTGLPAVTADRVLDEVLAATEQVTADWSNGLLPFAPQLVRDVVRIIRARRRACARA